MFPVMSLYDTHSTEIKTLYEQGMTMPKIAEKLGVSYPTINAILTKLGVEKRKGGTTGRRPASDLFSAAQVEEIRKRIEAGENYAAIGRAMGTTQTTIDRYAKRLGLWQPRKNLEEHAPAIAEKLASGVHIDQLTAEYDAARYTIYRAAKKAGLNTAEVAMQRRAAARPSKEERAKLDWARAKKRIQEDPEAMAAYKAKMKRARDRKAAKYAPVLDKFFAAGCSVCGDKREGGLDAHHRDPSQKLFNISSRTKDKVTVEQLEAELAKCDCLCAYCHRVKHFEQGDNIASGEAKSKTAKQVALARIRLKPVFDEFYADGCWVCGRDHPAGLSAHHVYPEQKSFNVSRAPFWRLSNELTKSELDKCACLCETCHRLIHLGELPCPVEPLQTRESPCTPS
jgi:transposase